MRAVLLAVGLAAVLPAQDATDATRLLEASARKYRDIGSYEASAIARRPLEGGASVQIRLRFAYASAKMTPPDLPVPMLPQVLQASPPEFSEPRARFSVAPPVSGFAFDRMASRVAGARIEGAEDVQSHPCKIVEVQYEGPRHGPVRYWIDPATLRVWKMQFSEGDASQAPWTVVWDAWTEDHAPPAWLIDAGKRMAGQERSALVGHEAPTIVGQTLDGKEFRLSGLKGAVVVLDFWATWCAPCSEEMASLERLKASLAGKRVEIWSVTEDNPESARRWIAERQRTLPAVIVAPDTVFAAYRVENLPQIVIVDQNGIVARQWVGLSSESDLDRAIETLLAR
jgi:peroxiredoxin